MRANTGTFLQLYWRKAQRGVEPNDHYDRGLEEKLKRMNPEDLSRLMSEGEDSEQGENG